MATNPTKQYKIVINGLTESIDQVKVLTNMLDELDSRIKNIESKGISVNASMGKIDTKQYEEVDKLDKQILATEDKLKQVQDERYQKLLQAKDALKEYTATAKAENANTNLTQGLWDEKTMVGIKAKLKDIKTAMQTLDVGSEEFKKMTEEANRLNSKLKEIEQSYGVYGRSVGDYTNSIKNAFDGITIDIDGVTYSFNNLRDASQQLKNAMGNLEIQGKNGTEQYEHLKDALEQVTKATQRLNSSLDDVKASSSVMDDMLDAAQSLAAISQTYNGLKAVFGFDNAAIDKSIQKLVALQSVLNGIETIRKQMNTAEGIGAILSKGNEAVDRFVSSLTKAELTTQGLTKASRAGTIAVRAFSTALKALGVGLAIGAITTLISGLQKVSDTMGEGLSKTELLNAEFDKLKDKFNARESQINRMYFSGLITQEEMFTQMLKNENDYIRENIRLLNERQSQGSNYRNVAEYFGQGSIGSQRYPSTGKSYTSRENVLGWVTGIPNDWFNMKVDTKNLAEAKNEFRRINEELKSGTNLWDDIIQKTKDYKNIQVSIGRDVLGDFVSRFDEATKDLDKNSEEGKRAIEELYNEMMRDDVLNSVLTNLDKFIPEEATRTAIDNIIGKVNELYNRLSTTSEAYQQASKQWALDKMPDSLQKTLSQIGLEMNEELKKWVGNESAQNLIREKYAKQVRDAYKEYARQASDAEREILETRIQAMEDGLTKTLAIIEAEREKRIEVVRREAQDNVDIAKYSAERIAAINAEQDKKILDAKRDWAKQMEDTFTSLEVSIFSTMNDIEQRLINTRLDNIDFNMFEEINQLTKGIQVPTYKVDTSGIRNSTFEALGIDRETVDDINTQYEKILWDTERYYNGLYAIQKEAIEKRLKEQETGYRLEYDSAVEAENRTYQQQRDEVEEKIRILEEGNNLSEEERQRFNNIIEDMERNHNNALLMLEQELQTKLKNERMNASQDAQDSFAQIFKGQISEIEQYIRDLDAIQASQPTMMKVLGLDVINVGKTRKQYKVALEGYKKVLEEIEAQRQSLEEEYDNGNGILSFEEYTAADNQLNQMKQSILSKTQDIIDSQKSLTDKVLGEINTYVQMVGGQILNIMQSLGEREDSMYDARIRKLEESIDDYEKLLDKQEEITQEHANKVDSIEDELQTARGDRRQELIDQLNAERAAQRESLAEQKRIEREKEKLEEKKRREEDARDKAQHDRQVQQAVASGALAIVNAFATAPFMPVGLAMGSLATILTAAQIATLKAQKYADGGVIDGKSHAQGGVKVLGGRAEVEGGEFITNKYSTSKNVRLLEFINGKKKRLDLEDFIDFYTSDGVRKNVTAISKRSKYADGGQLPLLRNDIDMPSRIIETLDAYANRPVVVSVVEIEDRMNDVNSVRAQAGLSE